MSKYHGEKKYMEYISILQAASLGVSAHMVHKQLEENRINGALRFGQAWMIPKYAEKPADARKTRYKKGGGGHDGG